MSVKVKDIKRNKHHGYEIQIDLSVLKEDEQDITVIEANKKGIKLNWVYSDTLEPVSNDRPCAHCKLNFAPGKVGSSVDPCLGELKGVWGACCGHGDLKKQYVNLVNGMQMNLDEYYAFIKDNPDFMLDESIKLKP